MCNYISSIIKKHLEIGMKVKTFLITHGTIYTLILIRRCNMYIYNYCKFLIYLRYNKLL